MFGRLNCAGHSGVAALGFPNVVLKSHRSFYRTCRDRPISTQSSQETNLPTGMSRGNLLLRKEVIQPQVPLRLPCYDFIPITSHTFGTFSGATSGTTGFHDVTGGVYKAWERIHGAVADAPLLAIPASCRRVADDNLNWARFSGICSTLRSCVPLCRAL